MPGGSTAARAQPHPEQVPYPGRFDPFHAAVSETRLMRFGNNRYSIQVAGRPGEIHAHADRIGSRQDRPSARRAPGETRGRSPPLAENLHGDDSYSVIRSSIGIGSSRSSTRSTPGTASASTRSAWRVGVERAKP